VALKAGLNDSLSSRLSDRPSCRLSWKHLQHHVYVVGQTGCGKSTLIRNAVVQLQKAQLRFPCAVVFIDPKGDDSLKLLRELETLESVAFLDPLVGFNVNPFELPPHRPEQRDWLVSQYIGYIMAVIQEWYGSTLESAPRMYRVMEALIRYLYAETDAPTWIDLHDLVVRLRSGEKEQVQPVLNRMADVLGRSQAVELQRALESIASLKGEAFDPVLHRIEKFATDPFLKRLFSVRHSSVDFQRLIQPGRVTIIRCAHVGEHIQGLIMSALVLKFWFTVQYRASVLPEEERTPVVLFIDEFQQLQSLGVLETLLAQARSFKLALWLSHQNLAQLDERLLRTVLGNTAVQAAGALAGEDARRLARNWDPQFADEIERTLVTMPFYTFMVRTRAFAGEQAPPRLVRAVEPPAEVRSAADVEAFLEQFRAVVQQPEPSILESAAKAVEKWVRFLPTPRLPSSVEWRLLLAFKGAKSLSFTAACELAALDRGSPAAREAWEALYAQRLTAVKASDEHGKPRSFQSSKTGAELLNPRFTAIGGGEAQAIAELAWRRYIERGWFCAVVRQQPGFEAPDLIAYDYSRLKAVSVEVESSSELRSHLEQAHRNMLKWREYGFSECHVWYPKMWDPEVKRIHEQLPPETRISVQLYPV
jgi:energy-coupling factor transporter ATP-binding protein EcfA2